MKHSIFHGLEYELQLMLETDNGLEIIDAGNYFNSNFDHDIFSSISNYISFDIGNIEIKTPLRNFYFEAVKSANYILINKLIPILINKCKLNKFALFLPVPMSQLIKTKIPIYDLKGEFIRLKKGFIPNLSPICFKHWNISYPSKYCQEIFNLCSSKEAIFTNEETCENFMTLYNEIKNKAIKSNEWEYDYQLLIKKGYMVNIKDLQCKDVSRIHIKIPYHYQPPEGNPDLMLNFEDTLIPPDTWRNLVCYYKNNVFTKIRDLI